MPKDAAPKTTEEPISFSQESAQQAAESLLNLTRLPDHRVTLNERWTRQERTGESSDAASRQIALEKFLNGESPRLFAGTINEAIRLESEAARLAEQARALRTEGVTLHAQWERMVTDYQSLCDRVFNAEDEFAKVRDGEAERMKNFLDSFGIRDGHSRIALDAILMNRQRLPLVAAARDHVREIFREHVKAMREFVKAHDLPKDLLTGLPTLP